MKRAGVEACGSKFLGKMVPVVGAIGGAISSARDVKRSGERALAQIEAERRPPPPSIASGARVIRLPLAATPPAPRQARAVSPARRAALEVAAAAIRAGDALAAAARRCQVATAS